MDSILDSIKEMLGVSKDHTVFDNQIITHINSVIIILNQMGVGKRNFILKDNSQIWSDFVTSIDEEAVKSYIYLKVKTIFDPPLSTAVLEANNKIINELEWRLNFAYENPEEENNG